MRLHSVPKSLYYLHSSEKRQFHVRTLEKVKKMGLSEPVFA